MKSFVQFLGSNPGIKNIVLTLGVDSEIDTVWEICRNLQLDTLSVYVPTDEQKKDVLSAFGVFAHEACELIPKEFKVSLVSEIREYRRNEGLTALVFVQPSSHESVNMLDFIRPDFLVGEVDAKELNAYLIWEAYRKTASHIYIVSVHANDREEALDWQKREDSDIELSIIFPMYNIAAYLPKCIQSVTAWKADYVEYLFVDDGSPDNCAQIVEEYAEKDFRIKLLQKKNGGCASARQYGLERATGRYVAFIDPDDYIDESMHRKLLSRALVGSYEISYCGYKELYEATGTVQEIDDVLGEPYCSGTADPKAIDELIAYRRIAIWRGIYLRELIDRNGIHFYEDLRRFDDLPFKVETFACAKSVVAIPEYLYYYRMARPGQDVAADDERLYVHFTIFDYLDKFLSRCRRTEQLDFLQIVKVQTHQWALEKMKPEFITEYCKLARKDIAMNHSFRNGLYVVNKYGSKKNTLYYVAIYHQWVWLVKRLIAYHRKADRKKEAAIEQLDLLSKKQFK